jgi:hypothetical protein
MRQREGEHYQPEMPPLTLRHLVGWLFEVGPVGSTGMGPVAVSFQEIAAWCSLTGVRLTSWEARMLRQLSHEYLSECHAAEEPLRAAPWRSAELAASASAGLRSHLRTLAQL